MASKRRLRRQKQRDSCEGKRRFPTEFDARKGISGMRHRTGNRDILVTYRCLFCGGYHYGHPRADVAGIIAERKSR